MEKEIKFQGRTVAYVSDMGDVFNAKHRKLKPQVDKAGYCSVVLGGHKKLVHRLVVEAFNGNLSDDVQVHHINENRSDNRLENLSVLTAQEHQHLHKQIYPVTKKCEICGKEFSPGKTKRKRAKTCSYECWKKSCKIGAAVRKRPVAQYSMDGELIRIWESARNIRDELGIFESNVNKCCNGKIHSYKGFIWKYAAEENAKGSETDA